MANNLGNRFVRAKYYTQGRDGRKLRYITVHHQAGKGSLAGFYQNPGRQTSAHFWVGSTPGAIEQYVDTNDTAYTNGNWTSNCESVTVETEGTWLNGYYNQQAIDNLAELMYRVFKAHGILPMTFHQDVSDTSTQCPGDLKHKGYARVAYNAAVARIEAEKLPPAPVPIQKKIKVTDITNKPVVTLRATQLWDLSFNTWGEAKSVKQFAANEVIHDISAIAEHPLGGKYYLTEYSFSKGIMNGINVVDVKDYTIPVPPTEPPVEPPVEPEPTPEPPVEEPPIVVVPPDTEIPEEDMNKLVAIFKQFVQGIVDVILKILGKKQKGE